jgi:hypothetical protein
MARQPCFMCCPSLAGLPASTHRRPCPHRLQTVGVAPERMRVVSVMPCVRKHLVYTHDTECRMQHAAMITITIQSPFNLGAAPCHEMP